MSRAIVILSVAAVAVLGCGPTQIAHGSGGSGATSGGGSGGGGSGSGGGGGGAGGGPCDPNAIEVPGNNQDDDCNGQVDEIAQGCDGANGGKSDATSLAQAMELCDARFFKGASTNGPSDLRARIVAAKFGTAVNPLAGANMAFLSTGLAVDKSSASFVEPQEGTDLVNAGTNPLPTLKGASNCGQAGTVTNVQDYTELVLQLKAPANAQSFSFQFHFFSAEYPEYVCTRYNDEFLVIVQSSKTYTQPTNISFDAKMNPITVNSGFFIVCTNGATPQTMNCTHPVSEIAGTGFDDDDGAGQPIGGSTGWLTTTAPIAPGEDVTLRFVIFDEGDGAYDSSALIDNFKWGATSVTGPSTGPIG